MKIERQRTPIEIGMLVVYDNVKAGKRAKELCDRIQRLLGPEYDLRPQPWNMAVLQTAPCAQAAMEAAELRGVLIVAIDGNQPLPEFFKRWASQCIRSPHSVIGALVVQIYGILRTTLEITPAYKDLRQIARNAAIPFLSEVVELPDFEMDRTINQIHEAARTKTGSF